MDPALCQRPLRKCITCRLARTCSFAMSAAAAPSSFVDSDWIISDCAVRSLPAAAAPSVCSDFISDALVELITLRHKQGICKGYFWLRCG